MRAALIREFGAPLEIAEIPPPEPGPGEVLIRVRAVGICATDVKLAEGKMPPPPPLPHVPGHEIAGEVAADHGDLDAGTRVACHIVDACNECADCRRGYPILCAEARRLGLDVAGGMAEYVAVPRGQILPIDDHIPFDHAAVAMESVTTPWAALHVTGALQPGELVVIVGVGGLGINALQLAVAAGARVAAVDVGDDRLEMARGHGAELAVDSGEAVAALAAWSGGGADMALELSGAAPASMSPRRRCAAADGSSAAATRRGSSTGWTRSASSSTTSGCSGRATSPSRTRRRRWRLSPVAR